MSLARYHRKRDFARTSEPRGKQAKTGKPAKAHGGHFVIHKHAASRLHYDLRLELDGVLKSWAVPKGPSLDPHQRRLAVHVEDHPLEYGAFEGNIPQGQYGGGAVVLWDRGEWIPEGDPHAAYRAGKLKFQLDGEKLHGGFNLVRMHGRSDDEHDNWLLIKEADETADDDGDRIIRDQPESVISGRTVEQIAAGEPARKTSKKAAKKAAKKTSKRPARTRTPRAKQSASKRTARSTRSEKTATEIPLPARIAPELATLVDAVPTGDDWLHEIKLDGYRLLVRADDGAVQLITRGEQDWTARLPAIARELGRRLAGRRAVVDGELVHLDADGITRFGSLQRALADQRATHLAFFAFDLLWLDGHDLRQLPLEQRKELLEKLLPPESAPGRVRLSEHILGNGAELLARACRLGLEGIISKRRDAPYRSVRTRDWLKVKCGRRQEVVIGGYTPARSGPRPIGALLVGVYDDDGNFNFSGKVGTGFDQREAARLHELLTARAVDKSPFAARLPPGVGPGKFVRPELIAEVRFSEWTADGRMRHPVYEAVREDRRPKTVRREDPAATAPARSSRAVEVLGVPLSHPDRVLFPADGITKRQLAEYYETIADAIMPHLENRPLSLVRCPDGVGKPCFFQRHLRHDLPAGIEAADLGDKGDDEPAFVYIREPRGLAALAQIGALELHPWGATIDAPDRPDRIVFDLDPAEDVPWDSVKAGARELHRRLDQLDLANFIKTTGGKGLHVVVPLTGGKSDWAEVKRFARGLVEAMVRDEPERYLAVASKARRRGKIYLDYLRNDRGATSIGAYSPRARPGAFVSTPLRWSELARLESSQAYDLAGVVARLSALRGDPWRELWRTRQQLSAALLRKVSASSG